MAFYVRSKCVLMAFHLSIPDDGADDALSVTDANLYSFCPMLLARKIYFLVACVNFERSNFDSHLSTLTTCTTLFTKMVSTVDQPRKKLILKLFRVLNF